MMNNVVNRSLQGGAAALALLLCGSALSADEQQQRSTSKSQQDASTSRGVQAGATKAGKQSAQGDQGDRAPSVVIGEVVDSRTVNLKGMQGVQHRLVKIELANGNTVVVDAGATKTADKALKNVEQGDRVLAVGRAGRINDRPVLIARSIGELYSTGVTSTQSASSGEQPRDAG